MGRGGGDISYSEAGAILKGREVSLLESKITIHACGRRRRHGDAGTIAQDWRETRVRKGRVL